MALQDRKLRKCISQIPLHFNKAIGEGNDSSNSNEKEKANYLKKYIKSCDKYKSDNESHEWNSSDGSDKDGSDSDSCNK